MDKALFSEKKNIEDLSSEEKCTEKKKSENGYPKTEDNFDFTSDIIDLLLCVENDENARQNIESIMDQWDEMNILEDDNLKSSILNAETNAQIKIKNLENSQEIKFQLRKSQGTRITFESEQLVHSDLIVRDTVETKQNNNSTNKILEEAENITNFADKKFLHVELHNQTSDCSNSVTSTSQKSFSGNSADAKPETDASSKDITNSSQNQLLINRQALNSFSVSRNQFQRTQKIQKIELTAKSDDDKLNERIKALFCAVCLKNYEQLMSSGEIKKMQCKPYPCPFCRGNYYQKLSANIHMKVHMEEESLKCRSCVDISEKLPEAVKHDPVNNQIENEDRTGKRLKLDPFICSICSVSLSSQSELVKHMTVHKSTLKFCRKYLKKQSMDCDCQKKTNGQVGGTEKSKNCRKCSKITTFQRQNKFECKTCGKRFINKSNFDFHCLSHNKKFTKIFDNIITEKSNCSSLDHSYGKPLTVAPNGRTVRGTDENENLKTSKSKIAIISDLELASKEGVENQNVEISLMEVDETVGGIENNMKLNGVSVNEFSSAVFEESSAQFDLSLSKYVECEQSSKTQTVYLLQDKVFNENESHLVNSPSADSPLLNNAFFSQYVKPDLKMNTDGELDHEKLLCNANEADSIPKNDLNVEKNTGDSFLNSHIVYQQNFDSDSGIPYKNSTVSYDGSSLLMNPANFNNNDILNSGLVSNDINELHSDELMSNDIDNIFQQYFYPQNDEKILNNEFSENVDVQSQVQLSVPNQILPFATSNTENLKIGKPVVYNSTADTLSQFINTNMSESAQLESNEIIQELFSNIDSTESTQIDYQPTTLNGIPISVTTQKTVEENSEPNSDASKNDELTSKTSNSSIKIQNANPVINLGNNSICLNNVLANISNLTSGSTVRSETTGSVLINQNQNNALESMTTREKTSLTSPKSYLVIYVLPPSNNAQTSANPTVTELNERKTVVSSTATNETLFKLPTVEGKMTYLVPIINNKVDNVTRTNDLLGQKGKFRNINSGIKKCERTQKNRCTERNGDVLKNSFRGRQIKSQQNDHNGKHDLKKEIRFTYTNGKCSNSMVGLPYNKYNGMQVQENDKVLKYDSDPKSNISDTTQGETKPTLRKDSAIDTTQKIFDQTIVNEKCNKRNILQIAYDDACKLIEDSVTKNVENEVNPSENSSMISTNCSRTQVTTKNVTSLTTAATSNTTLTGNYTLLKRMLNSKPCLPSDTVMKNDDDKNFQVPVEISFTNGQVTFQYSQNNVVENGKHDDTGSAKHVFQNAETRTNTQLTSFPIMSDVQEQCTCEICHKTFSKLEFLPHLKTHNKTLYKCTYCQEIFVQQLNLIQHMRTHLQPQVFNCKMCKKSFANVLLFRLHLLVHKGLLFICVSCIKLFNKKEEYENHLKTHSQNYLTCTQCKRNFPNAVSGSSVIQYFTCIECISSGKKLNQGESSSDDTILEDTQFDAKTNVKVHLHQDTEKSVVKQEPNTEFTASHFNGYEEDLCFLCQYCDKICNGGVEFKNHKVFHLKNKIHCVVCGEHFDKFATLRHHFKMHNVKKILKCDFCSETFYDKKTYQNHAHKNFKPYPCAICEESFCNRTDLTAHCANHVANSELICNYCGLKFVSTSLQTMLTHKKSHEIEKIVECDKCDDKFVFQSELKIHSLEIHNEQLLCALCNHIFENNESYVNHRKMHDSFKCDKCNFEFANETLLSKHKQTHLENVVFPCKHCELKFGEFNELLSHTIKLHPGKDFNCFKCSCCSRFFTNELQWTEHGKPVEKKAVLLPYSLKQFSDRSFKLEPDTKNIYSCHQCNENFRNKSEIIKHIKTH